jgi:hypothetical protein
MSAGGATESGVVVVIERRVLLDPDLEGTLVDRGYVVVPLLADDEVAALRDWYLRASVDRTHLPDDAYDPTYAEFTVIHADPRFRAESFEHIVDVVGGRVTSMLDRYRPLVANYVNKPVGSGVVPLHQNWSVVDEQRFRSVSVWIALVDCDSVNGALEVLDGSHRRLRDPRGMWAYEAFAGVADDVREVLELVPVPAGHAVILDDALLHYSAPNRGSEDRLAIQLIMLPGEAPSRFCERVDQVGDIMEVDVWEVEPRFFWDFWHGAGDQRYGRRVERIQLSLPQFDRDRFLRTFLPQ